MLKKTVKFLTLAIVFLCAVKISSAQQAQRCTPAPGPVPTLEELVQLAPIVVRGYVVQKIGDVNTYTACLYITHVYKGFLNSNYICADNFGSTALCLADPTYGVEYLFLLDKTPTGYRARYDYPFSAAQRFNDEALIAVRDAICCPGDLGGEYNVFTYNYIRPQLHYIGLLFIPDCFSDRIAYRMSKRDRITPLRMINYGRAHNGSLFVSPPEQSHIAPMCCTGSLRRSDCSVNETCIRYEN